MIEKLVCIALVIFLSMASIALAMVAAAAFQQIESPNPSIDRLEQRIESLEAWRMGKASERYQAARRKVKR